MVTAVLQRRRDRAKRRLRVGGAAAVVVGLASLFAFLANDPAGRRVGPSVAVVPTVFTTTTTTSPPIDPERARADAKQLVARADLYEAVVTRVQESSRSRTAAAASRSTRYATTELRLGLQREESTLLLLHQGDVLAREPDLRGQAAVSYRQATDMFPETHGAAVAKQRLDALN
jgi:hypothetical protein